MRTLCDVCESAAAILFCAADEAALCRSCDDKVHKCNKLASRHVRVGLAAPSDVPVCDICENAPAFFYCEVDGTSLCLQCDMIVHVGVKRIHKRFLLLRQQVEFPGDKPGGTEEAAIKPMDVCCGSGNKKGRDRCSGGDAQRNHKVPSIPVASGNGDGHVKKGTKMIDLNMKPHRFHGQASNYQET